MRRACFCILSLASVQWTFEDDSARVVERWRRPKVLVLSSFAHDRNGTFCGLWSSLLVATAELHFQFINLQELSYGLELLNTTHSRFAPNKVFDPFDAIVGCGAGDSVVDRLLRTHAPRSAVRSLVVMSTGEDGGRGVRPDDTASTASTTTYDFTILCDRGQCSVEANPEEQPFDMRCFGTSHIKAACEARQAGELYRLNLPVSDQLDQLGHAEVFTDGLERTCCPCGAWPGGCLFDCGETASVATTQ